MALHDPIDIYCERTDASWLSEPVNALTNLAFLVAAYFLLRHYRRLGQRDALIIPLMIIIALVGLGSMAFHFLATSGTLLLDVIPIAMFILYFLWLCFYRLFACSAIRSAWLALGFLGAQMFFTMLVGEETANRSMGYVPCLLALFAIAWALRRKNASASKHLFQSGLVFSASLFFRTVDMQLCDAFPLGTHFLWHILNGLLLYRFGYILMINNRKTA